MANLEITNNTNRSSWFWNPVFLALAVTFAGIATLLKGTILAFKSVADAVTVAFTGTGDGTVTAVVTSGPTIPIIGAHILEMIELGVKNGVAVITAAFTGTGNGTVTALVATPGPNGPKAGDFILELIKLGTAGGVAVGTAGYTGTGNGTASAVVCGALCKAGDYLITCFDATVSGSEIFSVVDPEGNRLADLVVGVAYLNEHFGLTLTDGGTDFVAGDLWTLTIVTTGGVFSLTDSSGNIISKDIVMDAGAGATTDIEIVGMSFTITAGATDFIVGDYFTLTVANTGGVFSFVDPNGKMLDNNIVMDAGALAATIVETSGFLFTITDGATDFIVGDFFTLTVVAADQVVPFEKDGAGGAQVPKYILTDALTSTGAGDVPCRLLVSGRVRKGDLVIDSDTDDSNVDQTVINQLRDFTMIPETVQQLGESDNA
jgi:hypothetical protein